MASKGKILIAYNQPSSGSFKNYDGRDNKETRGRKKIDLSEKGVIEEFEDTKQTLINIGFETESINVCRSFNELIDKVNSYHPDTVFNLVESIDGEAIKETYIAGLYELLNVAYTGNDSFTLSICLNKHFSKLLLKSFNIPTPGWRLYNNPDELIFDSGVKYPLIVKLAKEDASVGISEQSVVYDEDQLNKRISFMYDNFQQSMIAEEYIEGREINSAMLGYKDMQALPLSEIDFSTLPKDLPNIVTYDGKWIKSSIYYKSTIPVCPAKLDDQKSEEIKSLSKKLSKIFNLRDYARVDYRLSKDGMPYVIEVNPNPDISKDAGFPRAAKAFGLSYDQMLETIINFSLERKC